MEKEIELTILDINVEEIEKKLKELNAEFKGEFLQRRYVYDFIPETKNKWIRLRTNGNKTTLTIKDACQKNEFFKELEIKVDDFDKTNQILEELGYVHKLYQENKRKSYKLNDVNFDIDTWPYIPTFLEIEAKTEAELNEALKILNLEGKGVIKTLSERYELYGLDLNEYKNLKFGE